MGNSIAVVAAQPQQQSAVVSALTAKDIKEQVQRIQEVMRHVMKKGTHYDKIPGTDKETLLKPGSEMLLMTFHISCDPEVEDLSTADEIRYRVRAKGVHQTTGIVMGVGVGEASSNEEKYKWRRALCDEEFNSVDWDRRREKFKRSKDGVYTERQVRTNPSDVANTVLKMAKKRAQIDMTLTALACSDIFNQDLEETVEDGEDLSAQAQQRQTGKAGTTRAQSSGKGRDVATEKQLHMVRGRLDAAGLREVDFLAAMEIASIEQLPFGRVNDALDWIEKNRP